MFYNEMAKLKSKKTEIFCVYEEKKFGNIDSWCLEFDKTTQIRYEGKYLQNS